MTVVLLGRGSWKPTDRGIYTQRDQKLRKFLSQWRCDCKIVSISNQTSAVQKKKKKKVSWNPLYFLDFCVNKPHLRGSPEVSFRGIESELKAAFPSFINDCDKLQPYSPFKENLSSQPFNSAKVRW